MDRIRTFFAVEPPAAVRHAAVGASRPLRERAGDTVRWVAEEKLHVTLQFLGNIDPAIVPALALNVGAELAAVAPFPLRLGGLMAFPGPRRPRVIALDLEPHEPLTALAEAVKRGVENVGLPVEDRRFRPHLTLGRVKAVVKGRRRVLDVSEDVTAPDTAAGDAFDVTEAVLFRSQLQSSHGGSPHYTPLERIALGGTLHP